MEEKKYPKFLLYVREPRFYTEKNKSGLVTWLLREHYDRLEAGDTRSLAGTVKKVKKIAGASPQKVIKTPAEAVAGVKKTADIDFCKHGAMPGFCKHPKCPNWKRS